MSVLVVGDVVTDVVARLAAPLKPASDTDARITVGGGGQAANTACWLTAAGAKATLVARVGDDAAGRDQIRALRAAGVTTALAVDADAATGTIVVVVDHHGQRSMLTDRGANLHLGADDIDERLLADSAHLHVSGYALLHPGPRAAAQRALTMARRHGVPTSVDPASAAPLREVGGDRFLAWVDGVNLCSPNREELAVLTGETDPAAGARSLAARCGAVLASLGADGALWTDGGTLHHQPARAVRAIDTTGAGDALLAGFVAARLRGQAMPEALAAAVALAAQAVQRVGGRP